MGLTANAAHYSIRIKCQVPDCVNSFFFRLEIVRDWRAMWSGEGRVADQIEIWFGAAGNNGEADRVSVAALCLDIAQDGLALEPIETFSHRQCHPVFGKIIGKPRARFSVEIAVQQIGITMHETNLQLHHSQTRCRLACE